MAVLANILSIKARQNDGQNARRQPVDNGDQIGKVLAPGPMVTFAAGKKSAGCD
jgi:hypothetical protein